MFCIIYCDMYTSLVYGKNVTTSDPKQSYSTKVMPSARILGPSTNRKTDMNSDENKNINHYIILAAPIFMASPSHFIISIVMEFE